MILPHKLSNVDIVLNSLTNMKLVSYQKLEENEVQLAIPKFTIKSDTDLIPVLKNVSKDAATLNNIEKLFSCSTEKCFLYNSQEKIEK